MTMLLSFILLVSLFSSVFSASASSLECGACSLLVTQFEKKISQIDPKKTIKTGSYRVSPDGEQKGLKEVSYGRSDTHLTEVLENVCDEAKNYKFVVNTLTGKQVYIHKDDTYLKGDESSQIKAKLQGACNDFIDEYEEDLLKFLKSVHENPVKEFCHMQMNVCTSVDVAEFPPNEPKVDENEPMEISDIPSDEL